MTDNMYRKNTTSGKNYEMVEKYVRGQVWMYIESEHMTKAKKYEKVDVLCGSHPFIILAISGDNRYVSGYFITSNINNVSEYDIILRNHELEQKRIICTQMQTIDTKFLKYYMYTVPNAMLYDIAENTYKYLGFSVNTDKEEKMMNYIINKFLDDSVIVTEDYIDSINVEDLYLLYTEYSKSKELQFVSLEKFKNVLSTLSVFCKDSTFYGLKINQKFIQDNISKINRKNTVLETVIMPEKSKTLRSKTRNKTWTMKQKEEFLENAKKMTNKELQELYGFKNTVTVSQYKSKFKSELARV